jgi:hypothetical protein
MDLLDRIKKALFHFLQVKHFVFRFQQFDRHTSVVNDTNVVEYEFVNWGDNAVDINGAILLPLGTGFNRMKLDIRDHEKDTTIYRVKFIENGGFCAGDLNFFQLPLPQLCCTPEIEINARFRNETFFLTWIINGGAPNITSSINITGFTTVLQMQNAIDNDPVYIAWKASAANNNITIIDFNFDNTNLAIIFKICTGANVNGLDGGLKIVAGGNQQRQEESFTCSPCTSTIDISADINDNKYLQFYFNNVAVTGFLDQSIILTAAALQAAIDADPVYIAWKATNVYNQIVINSYTPPSQGGTFLNSTMTTGLDTSGGQAYGIKIFDSAFQEQADNEQTFTCQGFFEECSLQFFIGMTPLTNIITINNGMSQAAMQAAINANIIVPNTLIFITSFTPPTMSVNILIGTTIPILGELKGQLICGEEIEVVFAPLVCSLKQNRLLVISKMLAGLDNNP